MRQRRHPPGHLLWRGVVAAASDLLMVSGVYPFVPHAGMAWSRWRKERPSPPGQVRVAVREWGAALALSAARPLGFLPLPGRSTQGPRPIILLHGYAMNRANFIVLARRLAAAGLGPVLGFEYWTLGKTGSAARRLARYVDEVCAATGAVEVDLIGHSMGGVVGRYYVTLGGGDARVANLITLGSPHSGTDVSAIGLGAPTKELFLNSTLIQRLDAAPRPSHSRMTVIWSRSDALVPGARHARIDGVDEVLYDDLGHLSLLTDRRVADEVIARLAR
ncbi:MAG: alpha/beta fold hydrolase [Myxococcales bacterium]|nr:alpha/beta fold hydrolase [Myxococcales bacterium]